MTTAPRGQVSEVRYERFSPDGHIWHELANLFPMIAPGSPELADFEADVEKNGVQEAIVFYEGKVLDGRNRFMAARQFHQEYPRVDYLGDDPLAFVVSLNLKRRHLSENMRASIAAKIADMPQGARTDLSPIGGMSQERAAQMMNVSKRNVERATAVQKTGVPELVAVMEADVVSVAAAADVATLPISEQLRILAQNNPRAVLDAAKGVRSERADKKRVARNENLIALSNKNAPLPQDRKYPIIYADPPWQYDFSPSDDRSVENHYPTMDIDSICALPVEAIATPDAMLFLWAPPSFIKKGIMVLEAWGFELASSMVWDKGKMGTGIYFRQQHEYLLLGKRGQPITPRPGSQPASVLRAERGAHSEKPVEAYAIIEAMYPGLPKIELFSRNAREGFDAWGNQSEAA